MTALVPILLDRGPQHPGAAQTPGRPSGPTEENQLQSWPPWTSHQLVRRSSQLDGLILVFVNKRNKIIVSEHCEANVYLSEMTEGNCRKTLQLPRGEVSREAPQEGVRLEKKKDKLLREAKRLSPWPDPNKEGNTQDKGKMERAPVTTRKSARTLWVLWD